VLLANPYPVDGDSPLSFEVLFRRVPGTTPSTLELVIRAVDTVLIDTDGDDPNSQPPAPQLQDERIILDPIPIGTGQAVALIVPAKVGGSSTRSFLVFIDVVGSPLTVGDEAADTTRRLVDASVKSIASRPSQYPGEVDLTPGILTALASAGEISSNQAALAYAATQTKAAIAIDFVLSASRQELEAFHHLLQAVLESAPKPAPVLSTEILGWIIDLKALEAMVDLQSKNQLSAELATVLTIHAGEAGRSPGSMSDVMKGVRSKDDLHARLQAENLLFLEDSQPASRVRAFDWLASRGLAPANFDPLGRPRARRLALEAAREQSSSITQTTQAVTEP